MFVPSFVPTDEFALSREASVAHAVRTALEEGRLTRPPSALRRHSVAALRRIARLVRRNRDQSFALAARSCSTSSSAP